MRLADVSIRRPVFAVMLVGGFIVLGIVSLPRLGVDLFPRVEMPIVTVVTRLDGAAPETVERAVTQVLEESINTIEGIRSLSSQSTDSLSLIYIEFELEYDIGRKLQEVRDQVAAVSSEIPQDAEVPVVNRVDPDAAPILAVMLSGPHAIRTVSEFADKHVKTRLERVPGVGSVTLAGDRPREIRVWIDPLRLGGYGLAVDDVIVALQREHVEMPGGRLESGSGEWSLKTLGKLTNANQFGSLVVAERQGRTIHLSDVTTVEDGMAEERTVSRLNGKRGVSLLIRRQSGENTVEVAKAVKQELARIRAELPPGYQMAVALDSSVFITSAIRDVGIDIAYGAGLAALVVLLFLRNFRSTAITALAIPASLVASFVFFYAFSFTLNTMTLMALSLSIGMLIDDAIVVLENIYRHMDEEGREPAEAASVGTDEIGLAVVATTLATCAVFVPIAFMSGIVGRFFREFGLAASSAVLVSMLVSLTLTPMLCARYLRVQRQQGRVFWALERGYRALESAYRRVLAGGLRHRPAVVALALAAMLGGIALAGAVPIDFVLQEDRAEFNVWLKRPLGSSLEQTLAVVESVEAELHTIPEVSLSFTTIGSGAKKRVNEALVYVQLVHKSQRQKTQQQVMGEVRERIRTKQLPLRDFAVEEIGIISLPGSRHAQLMYSLRGPNIDRLNYYASTLVAKMRAAGGYADLYLSYETGKPEIALDITRERAADLGVSALQIGRTVSALYAGFKAASFEEGGERYDVRVQVRPEYRDDLEQLELVRVRAQSGALVPLRNLVTPRIGSGPVQIDRESRTRAITVFGNLAEKAAGDADLEIARFARELELPAEYSFQAVGPSQRLRESFSAVLFAFAFAMVAIYMILAAQFDSFVHPFTMMLSAPLSFVGAFAAIWVSGYSLDVLGQISFLMLMGIVMKNGILLIDYTNTLRARGLPLLDAVLKAGPTRLRPVLMTAVSTIFGMLPVAFGRGDGSEWRNPMGIVCIGGLVTSTLLTLLVVPVVYTLVDDAQRAGSRALARLRGHAEPRDADVHST